MNQMTGTLTSLGVYLAFVAVGAVLGSRPAVRSRPLPWFGRMQTLALMILVFSLGVQLGANREVVSSLGAIGLSALTVTLFAMAGSLGAVFLLRRFCLGLDRQGRTPQQAAQDILQEQSHAPAKADNTLTFIIVGAVALGMLAGHFLVPAPLASACGSVVQFGLYLLLFLVGLDMGRQGTLFQDIRSAGLRVLLVPVATAVGTLAFAGLAGLFLPLGVKDSMAAAAGMGWYSLAPTLLAPYSLSVSAVSFLSNVMREVLSILTVPLAARWVGYVESVSLAGSTSMDTLLPVVVGATHERITIYSFASGALLSLAVPLLVPAVIALPL